MKKHMTKAQMAQVVDHLNALHNLGCAVVIITPDDAVTAGVQPHRMNVDAIEERLIELSWDIIADTRF